MVKTIRKTRVSALALLLVVSGCITKSNSLQGEIYSNSHSEVRRNSVFILVPPRSGDFLEDQIASQVEAVFVDHGYVPRIRRSQTEIAINYRYDEEDGRLFFAIEIIDYKRTMVTKAKVKMWEGLIVARVSKENMLHLAKPLTELLIAQINLNNRQKKFSLQIQKEELSRPKSERGT